MDLCQKVQKVKRKWRHWKKEPQQFSGSFFSREIYYDGLLKLQSTRMTSSPT